MQIRNPFRSLFRRAAAAPAVDPVVAVAAGIAGCLGYPGGFLRTRERANAAVEAFLNLQPEEQSTVADRISALNRKERPDIGTLCARIEESELFGYRGDRALLFDAFETPRRQALSIVASASDGPAMLRRLGEVGDPGLAADAAEILAASGRE